jgi:predicted outer membrane repeat protein
MFSLVLLGLVIIFSYGVSNVSAASGDIIYVNDSSGNDAWNGLNSTYISGIDGPKATIKNATSTVISGGTVYIAKGNYSENNITINNNMNIIGESKSDTLINGENSGTIFDITSDVIVNISNLTFINGNTDNGGAIYNNGYLTLTGCDLINNTAGVSGGAIYNSGTLNPIGSNFINNTSANFGGAIYSDGILNVTGGTFSSNMGGMGGAIYNYNVLFVSGSNFTNNTGCDGGAIVNEGSLIETGSTFTSNNAMCAGGAIITFNDCTLTVNNGTFTGNSANFGGAFVNYGEVDVTGSTFKNNTANQWGGVIYNYGTGNFHFNRIIGNTAGKGNAIYNYYSTMDASDNWWGDNNGPSIGNDVVGLTIPSWLVLKLSANPISIQYNSHSTIIADLRYDNLGSLAGGYLPNGIPVTFTTNLGTINPSSTFNGIATSILTSGGTGGTATISTYLDSQPVSTFVIIKDTIPPKISSTSPKNGAKGISRTATIAIKFSEKIKNSSFWSKIMVKNSKGQTVKISKSISGTTLNIKTRTKRTANSWYTVTIPRAAIKDLAGKNLQANYTFKFKTGK